MPFFSKKEHKEVDITSATANGSDVNNGVVTSEHKTKELNIVTDHHHHQSTANHTPGNSEKKSKSKKLHHKTVADTPSPVPLGARSDKDAWQSMQSLEEALENIANGDHPPRVARSIPKGIYIDSSKMPDKSMQHCLYERQVYEHMLEDSLDVCQLLQTNLDAEIDRVRSSAPASETDAPPARPRRGMGEQQQVRFKDADNDQQSTQPTTNDNAGDDKLATESNSSSKKENKFGGWFGSSKKRPAVTVKNF